LHLLEINKENGKSLEELIESNKNVKKNPTSIKDLLIILKGFDRLASIFLGQK
jgi:hypothetical protein